MHGSKHETLLRRIMTFLMVPGVTTIAIVTSFSLSATVAAVAAAGLYGHLTPTHHTVPVLITRAARATTSESSHPVLYHSTTVAPSAQTTSIDSPRHSASSLTDPLTSTLRRLDLVRPYAQPASLYIFRSANVYIKSQSGEAFAAPLITAGTGLYAQLDPTLNVPPLSFNGGQPLLNSWTLSVAPADSTTSGNSTVTVTMRYSGEVVVIPVAWTPTPDFSLTKGTLTRSDQATTITYTGHFSIEPNAAFNLYGTPTISILMLHQEECINTASIQQTIPYAEQNDFSVTCVVARRPVWHPGDGPPPSIATSLYIEASVGATLPSGDSVPWSVSPHVGYEVTAPYDQ